MPAKTVRQFIIGYGAAFGAFATLTLIGALSLANQLFNLPFVPFDIFDWMARTLPGALIGFVIELMVAIISAFRTFVPIGNTSTAAKLAEQSIAIIQFILAGAVVGCLLAWIQTKRKSIFGGQIAGLFLLAFTILVESSLSNAQALGLAPVWLGLLFVCWGWILAVLIQKAAQLPRESKPGELSRRQFLAVSGATLAAAAFSTWGLSQLFGKETATKIGEASSTPPSNKDPFGASLTSGPAASPSPEQLAARTQPVQGTRPELTANDDFYRIDIDTIPPQVDESSWKLKLSGLVDTPFELDLDQIRSMPSQTQILTMQCISNPVGGDLTSSSRWTGVRVKDILSRANVEGSAIGAYITAVDGFYEFVTMEDLLDERTLLVYEMNGAPLPREHGFPLRIYIPNRYGMKQPKWIDTIELVAEPKTGYWVERGWDREARPETVSVVDTAVVDLDQGLALCGGIAWAGIRGISKVEVQVDDGDWKTAELIEPGLSQLTWVLWRYSFPHENGRHRVSVRAYDKSGQLQTSRNSSPGPRGATGIHSVVVNLQG